MPLLWSYSGLFSSFIKHIVITLILKNPVSSCIWWICTVTAVLAARLFLTHQKNIFIIELLTLVLILTTAINIEGAIITSFFLQLFNNFYRRPFNYRLYFITFKARFSAFIQCLSFTNSSQFYRQRTCRIFKLDFLLCRAFYNAFIIEKSEKFDYSDKSLNLH